MATTEYKKFLYISGSGQKFADVENEIINENGKYYKTIVFDVETLTLWNRGHKFGLSREDAQRITDLETASAALAKAKLIVDASDKVLTITDGESERTVKTTLSLDYSAEDKKIYLKGVGNAVVAELDTTAFVKSNIVSKGEIVSVAEEGVEIETPYIKLSFASDADPVRFPIKNLVDVYDAANIRLTSAYEAKETFNPANIKTGASMDEVVAELIAGISQASASGVTSIGGKTGEITLKGSLTGNGDINLSIGENGEITAAIVGLQSSAFVAATEFATAEQGNKADSAIQSITIGGQTITKDSNELSTEQLLSALSITTKDIESATKEDDGFAKASDVKAYIDGKLAESDWEVL